jgi:hypothetical protein
MGGIYRVGMKFEIFRFFGFFGALMIKWLVFSSNSRIRIQMVKF